MIDQLTNVETKLQLILNQIPSTGDFVSILKDQFNNGEIGRQDEFLRVQRGLHHVTARMDEIEDFKEFWKEHKDVFKRWIKKKNLPLNVKPTDIANAGFFSFIQSPLGQSCYQICILNGWPTSEEWKKWEAWWNIQLQKVTDVQNHTGIKTVTSAWPLQVVTTSDMIMHEIRQIITAAAENMAQINLEQLLWKTAFIQNALTEIGIFPQQNENSWFAELWNFNRKLPEAKHDLHTIQKMLVKILPNKTQADYILHVSTPHKDWIPFKDHKLLAAAKDIPVPRIRSIPEQYRMMLNREQNTDEVLDSPGAKSKDKKSKKRKQREPIKTLIKKRKETSSEESSSPESSSEDETTKNVVHITSSTSEDEDFN